MKSVSLKPFSQTEHNKAFRHRWGSGKVEIPDADDEADKQIVWIEKDTNKVPKISAILTALGGAKLTSELTQ